MQYAAFGQRIERHGKIYCIFLGNPTAHLSRKQCDPIDHVKQSERCWNRRQPDLLNLLRSLPLSPSDERGHQGELQQDEEDGADAHHHPDVKEAHVAHLKV